MQINWLDMWRPELHPLEVVLRATIIYVFIQTLFRAIGRKEMGRYSTFDVTLLFLITTAARTSIVARDISVTNALVGLSTIVGLNWLLSYLSFRSERFAEIIEGPIRPLILDGQLQRHNLRRARVAVHDLEAALREKGQEDLEQVKDAFLERSGKITFILKKDAKG